MARNFNLDGIFGEEVKESAAQAGVDTDRLADMIADKIREKDAAEKAAKAEQERMEKAAKAQKKKDDDPFQRMTFIVRKDYLSLLREYAAEQRMTVKDVLDQALAEFIKKHKL